MMYEIGLTGIAKIGPKVEYSTSSRHEAVNASIAQQMAVAALLHEYPIDEATIVTDWVKAVSR